MIFDKNTFSTRQDSNMLEFYILYHSWMKLTILEVATPRILRLYVTCCPKISMKNENRKTIVDAGQIKVSRCQKIKTQRRYIE